jgi:hypothetical protein
VDTASAPELPPSQAVAEVRSGPAPGPLTVAGRWAWYWGLTLLVGVTATGLLVFGGRLPGRPALLLGLAVAAAAAARRDDRRSPHASAKSRSAQRASRNGQAGYNCCSRYGHNRANPFP